MVSGTVCGYKYFDIENLRSIRVRVRGFVDGDFSVRIGIDGKPLGKVHLGKMNFWTMHEIPVEPVNIKAAAIYFEYRGSGALQFERFELIMEHR